MKVVLFCGGMGTRLREYSETIPKPMVEIGGRPLLWHLMRYYAHFGHKDFILCLGDKGDYIKECFRDHDGDWSNDLPLATGYRTAKLIDRDAHDWNVSFVDTGLNANIGQRLMAVREYVAGESVFMANYGDGLSDLDLNEYLNRFERSDKTAGLLCVKPSQSFHVVSLREDGRVQRLEQAAQSELWINGGFFVFKQQVFDYIRDGEELLDQPFHRLMAEDQLIAYRNEGFWACIDTLKDKTMFDDLVARGETPWAVWESANDSGRTAVAQDSG